jgi:hypothetical protein
MMGPQDRPVVLRGEALTIRSLHPFDRRGTGHALDGTRQPNTLDGLVTCTMPFISAMRDDNPRASMTVTL